MRVFASRTGLRSISVCAAGLWLCASAACVAVPAGSEPAAAAAEAAAIRTTIAAQSDAWNKADIPGFMQAYENAPDTTFVGRTVNQGYEPILKRYMASYATAAQMGKLSFTDLEVRLLPSACGAAEYALVTGKFHLERTEKGAGTKDDGVFSLVWHKGASGWKIILDHTS